MKYSKLYSKYIMQYIMFFAYKTQYSCALQIRDSENCFTYLLYLYTYGIYIAFRCLLGKMLSRPVIPSYIKEKTNQF